MKLSAIPAERAFDVLADVAEPLSNIAGDEMLLKAFQGMQAGETSPATIAKIVGLIAQSHKTDLNAILAATEGQTVDEYLAGRSAARVIVDAVELLSDDQLASFLASPATGPSDLA